MKLKDFTVIQVWGVDKNDKIFILAQIIPQDDERTIIDLKKIVESFKPKSKEEMEFLRK